MMKKTKRILALTLTAWSLLSLTACSGPKASETATTEKQAAGESTTAEKTEAAKGEGKREKLVISTYLADAAQVAVREKYIDGPLQEAFPDVDIEIKMYNDRQSLQVEVAGGGESVK